MVNNVLSKYLHESEKKLEVWVVGHYLQLAIFNVILLFLILLRSAGYFKPILELSINLIVFISIFLAIILFNAGSRALFLTSIIFFMIAIPFKIVYILEVWSERTVFYAFEAMVLGLIVLIIENFLQQKEDG